VSIGYTPDNLVDYSFYYNSLIDMKYPYIVMAGEFDMKDGAISQYDWMHQLLLAVGTDFWNLNRKIYYFKDP
jgi:hypothetical protein